jgi:predicted nucleic acid-binding protein
VIASSAQAHNLILVTKNVSDFTSLDIAILNIFDNKIDE